jgi:hypothetical protein
MSIDYDLLTHQYDEFNILMSEAKDDGASIEDMAVYLGILNLLEYLIENKADSNLNDADETGVETIEDWSCTAENIPHTDKYLRPLWRLRENDYSIT